jgi:hypothetical protein
LTVSLTNFANGNMTQVTFRRLCNVPKSNGITHLESAQGK